MPLIDPADMISAIFVIKGSDTVTTTQTTPSTTIPGIGTPPNGTPPTTVPGTSFDVDEQVDTVDFEQGYYNRNMVAAINRNKDNSLYTDLTLTDGQIKTITTNLSDTYNNITT
jgi:hypothetical protein